MSVLVRRTKGEALAYFQGALAAYKHMQGHSWETLEDLKLNKDRIDAFLNITEAQLKAFEEQHANVRNEEVPP